MLSFLYETFLQEGHDMGNQGGNNYEYRILIALRRVIRAVDIYSRKLHTELGITTPQLLCLHTVAKSESMTLTNLAQRVNLSVSTVNGIIDRLEARQYLTRKRSVDDRRKVYLEISLAGKEIVTRAPSLLQDKLAAALSRLTQAEQVATTEALERVVELMEVETIDASPNLFSSELPTDSSL